MKQNILPLRKKILAWYQKNKRDLPWRENQDPYRVWISEIMLQQTQVATVIAYYERWMRVFPDIERLAKSPLEQVLKQWEGLGYYSRARNLHKAAQQIVSEHGGEFPSDFDAMLELPGIGRYTAGAIASIAFNQVKPVLDGNVMRVLSRLLGYRGNIASPKSQKKLWEEAEQLLSPSCPGDFNQAMMEIGALVCTPTSPACLPCPVRLDCRAAALGKQEKFPVKTKMIYEKLSVAVGVIWKGKKVLIQKRPVSARMGGLWEFPGGKVENGETVDAALLRELKEELGIIVEITGRHAAIPHAYTRFRVTLHPFDCVIMRGKPKLLFADELKWVSLDELDQYAFPSANLKLIKMLRE